MIFLLVAFILAGITLVYWQQIRQIQLEETQIQEDLLASYRTRGQAVAHADFDLVVHLISPQDPAWLNA